MTGGTSWDSILELYKGSDSETDLTALSKKKMMSSESTNIAGEFSNIVGSFINYNALKSDLKNKMLQADSIELAAKQQANQIREQFLQSAANYSYNAARRGISVNSASVQSNLQGSAEAMGKDIQRMQQNAYLEASAMRTQAKIAKIYGKAEHKRQVTNSISNIVSSGAKMYAMGGA